MRDKTMLQLAKALALNGSDEAKADAYALIEKVKQGGNAQLLLNQIALAAEYQRKLFVEIGFK